MEEFQVSFIPQRGLSGILAQGQMFSGSEKAFPSDELVHQGPEAQALSSIG